MIKRSGFKILCLFIIVFFISSCSLFKSSEKSQAEQAQSRHLKGKILTYEKAKEEHLQKQSERTLDMMKRSKKRSKKLNRIHRESWIKRFLGL